MRESSRQRARSRVGARVAAGRDTEERLACLQLHLALLYRPLVADALHEEFGSALAVFEALELPEGRDDVPPTQRGCRTPVDPDEDCGSPRSFGAALRRRLRDQRWRADAQRAERHAERERDAVLVRADPSWPTSLGELGGSGMPLALFLRGETRLPSALRSVAIVGTRRPSPYGLRQARRFAEAFARSGLTVVSGLARGVDGEAHRAALRAGGRSIAVLGTGLDTVYPREHAALAEELAESGALVTEFPHSSRPLRHHFPQRNRVLSGLAGVTVVIEAGRKSGSLLTVDWALRQGRQVFVLPGRVETDEARGCLDLIQSGAPIAGSPDDVIEALEDLAPRALVADDSVDRDAIEEDASRQGRDGHEPDRVGLSEACLADPFLAQLRGLFECRDAWHPDELCATLRVDPATLLRELCRLEDAAWIRTLDSGEIVLARV